MKLSFKTIDLIYISTIARTSNFSQSAEVLGISQPNLSRAVTIMEEQIGLKIFDRSARPLQLTKFGKEFMPYINTYINSHSTLVDFVENYKQSSAGNIRLHAPTGQLMFISKYIIPKLQQRYPELKVELLTCNLLTREYLEGAAFSPWCDILFTHALPKNSDLVAIKSTPMTLNVYGEKKFIQYHQVNSLDDYCQYPCVLFSSFMDNWGNEWHFIDNECNKDVTILVNGSYVCDNACTALELARAGIGYFYVPDIFVYEMGCAEFIFPTLPPRYTSSINNYMIYHRRTYQPYRVEVVISLMSEIISDTISDFNDAIKPHRI